MLNIASVMLRSSLLIPSAVVRRLIVTYASVVKSDKLPQIKVALCLQRYVHLSPEMNQLEKDYTNLITQLEAEHSYLSDHELRHKKEQELLKQRQNSPTTASTTTNIVETVVDLEDRYAKEFANFQFMSRETEDDKKNNLQSHNRKLDQHLLLIVQQTNPQTNKDEWIFPEKTYEGEPSLRAAAEKIISKCGHIYAHIAGNAPLAFYKNETDPTSKKIFFYKAEYLSGSIKQFSTLKTSPYKDHAWITHEELPKYLSAPYYDAVKDMLFLF